MVLKVTLLFAAVAAILNMWLATRIGRMRVSEKVLHGDGGLPLMMQRMRAQANFVEYTPFVLILAGLIELARGSMLWLWIAAAAYSVGRLLHGLGMDSDKPNWMRAVGILLTYVVTIALVTWALWIGYTDGGAMLAPAMEGSSA